MKERKNYGAGKKCLLGASLLFAMSGLATLGACSGGVGGYVVPSEKTVEVGFAYAPDFGLQNGVEATIVKLQVPLTSKACIKDGTFTPDVTGEYTYTVRFRESTDSGVKEEEKTITVKAVDTTAPVISAIADKQVEIGEYSAFANDIANITVTDNCAQNVNVYAESIVHNGVTTALNGETSVTLSSVGEYVVNVVAEDFSGNKARTSYKINATDTTAPVIQSKDVAIAWAKNGKVALPKLNVIDVANCTVTKTLKNSAGKEIAVAQDDTANLSVGVYTIDYLAKDASGNEASKTIKFIVNEAGVISNFTQAGEDDLWTAYGLRISNGSLGVYDKRSNTATLQYTDGFAVGDWSDFVSFDAELKNNSGTYLSVTPYFYVNGAWVETSMQTLKGDETKTLKVYLADYGIEKVDGVKFVLNCDGGVDALVNSVKVSKTADGREFPTGGYTAHVVSAQGSKEIFVDQATNNKGVVKYVVYANVDCDIMTTLKYENGSVISSQSLKAGYNEITRYPDAEAGESLTNSKLKSLIVSNVENYDVKLYVANTFTYESISSIDINAYARTDGSFTVDYNETFAIPSPFTSSLRWYNDLKITLKKGNTTVRDNLSIGDWLDATEGGLPAGNYSIVYAFKDLVGVNKTITYSLEVKQNALTATLTMPTLFAVMDVYEELPDPVITSEIYGDSVVQNGATVNKYYRLMGKHTWEKAVDGEPFMPIPNKTYEIRYTIEYQGEYREIYEQKFIHNDAYTLDFEPDASLTENLAFMGEDPANPGSYLKVRQRYLYDGGIYAYTTKRSDIFLWPTTDWSKSGQQSLTLFSTVIGASTILIRPLIANDKGINAISFWMKSDRAVSDFYVNIGIGAADGDIPFVKNGWRSSEMFTLLEGEHFYTVYLEEPIMPFESIGAFGMVMPSMVRMYLDDVSFVHIDRFEIEDTNDYKEDLDHTDGYELTKPIATSDVLTAEELAQVSYVLTYSLNGKDELEIKPDSNGKYILKLAEDEYGEVQFKWTATTPNKWTSVGGVVTRTLTSPIVMIKAVRLDIEHDEVVRQDTDVQLNAPTTTRGTVSNAMLEYNSTGEWKQMPEEDGKYLLPTETYGWYQLRYTADVKMSDTLTVKGIAMSEIYVRDKYVFIDFEGSDPYLGGKAYFNSYGGGSIPGAELVYDKETRNTYQKILVVNNSAEGVYFEEAIELEQTYNIINVKLYAGRALVNYPVQAWIGSSASTLKWHEIFLNLEAGWNDVYLEVPNFKYFRSFVGRMLSDFGSVSIDDISLLNIEFSGELPKTVYYGNETTLPVATLKGVQSNVSYRLKGSDEWKTVENNKFNPETLGTYEIRFSFDGVSEMIKEISVELQSTELQNFPTNAKSGDTIPVPTLTAGTESSKAFYREKGVEDWTAVTGNSFVVAKSGAYEVKFYFETIDASIVKTITVTPDNEFLLTDFEEPFDTNPTVDSYYTTAARIHMYPITLNGVTYIGGYPHDKSITGYNQSQLYEWNTDSTGNHVFHLVNSTGYDGPYWLNGGIEFGFTTNTFKIKTNATQSKIEYFYITWWDANNNKHELNLENGLTIDWANAVDLGNGWKDITVTMTESTHRVSGFSFWTKYYDIDDIRAIDTSKN